jgi:RNA-splicing ligase RtcB
MPYYIDTNEMILRKGAGRIMSRNKAKSTLSLEEYRKTMEDIIDVIRESVEVIDVLKPVYNFKASE